MNDKLSAFSSFLNSDKGKNFQKGMTAFNNGLAIANKAMPDYKTGNGLDFLSLNQATRSSSGNPIFDTVGSAVDSTVQGIDMIDKAIQNNKRRNRMSLNEIVGTFGYGGNLFDIGGTLDTVSNVAQTATSLIGNGISQAQIRNTDDISKAIKNSSVAGYSSGMSFDDLSSQWANTSQLNHLKWQDLRPNSIGSDILNGVSAGNQGAQAGFKVGGGIGAAVGGVVGALGSVIGSLFGRAKAKRRARKLNAQIDYQNDLNTRTLENNLTNVSDTQMDNLLANYAAYGGPLEYDITNTAANTNLIEAKDQKLTSIPNYSTLNSNNTIPFAFGGALHTQGGIWDNGIIEVNEGGTHEQNPQLGVPMGTAPDGVPNLVEEGEVIYNDYVYSNRLKVPSNIIKRYKLEKGSTFAEAVKQVSKESKERPNDPISKAAFEEALDTFKEAQEELREEKEMRKQKKQQELGAQPMIPMGEPQYSDMIPQQGIPEQMPIQQDYNPMYAANGGYLFDEGGLLSQAEYEERMKFLKKNDKKIKKLFAEKNKEIKKSVKEAEKDTKRKAKDDSWLGNSEKNLDTKLRYAPVAGSLLGLGLSFIPADYKNANELKEAAKNAAQYDRIEFNPIGNYLTYRPLDTNYQANQLRAAERANSRNLINLAGGNRGAAMAGLLSNNYNSQIALANAYRAAAESNREQEQKVEEFNRGTNITNSNGFLEAARANQAARASAAAQYLNALNESVKMRQNIDDARDNSRAANLSNLFESLGNIGYENFVMNQINSTYPYGVNKAGTTNYMRDNEVSHKYGGLLTKSKAKRRCK